MSLNAAKAPIMTIPEMAFVTLINDACKEGVTRQMAKYPMKHDSINISMYSIFSPKEFVLSGRAYSLGSGEISSDVFLSE